MTRALLTLAQGRRHLNLDDSYYDVEVVEKIEDASEIILKHLKTVEFLDSSGNVEMGSDGTPDIPGNVRAATKLMLGYLWEHRDEDDKGAYVNGQLPQPVVALLCADRAPTLA